MRSNAEGLGTTFSIEDRGITPPGAAGHLDQIIQTRRSIRRYAPDPIPRELLDQILGAAMRAPSPHNRQPWRFAVLKNATSKARLAMAMGERLRADRTRDGDRTDAIEADVTRSRTRIVGAPVVIVVALTMRDMDQYADQHRTHAEHTMAVQSVATVAQNILLLAHARGLGSCWMCAPLFCPDVVRTSLALPADWEPQALITLGRPASPGRDRPLLAADETIVWIDDDAD
ncbi:MAG TPA: nitroreductase family protein [Propionibacteriaceae bacterium]|nr:nitroreductase family protein [Propionibacteriaceae bacterium]